jgi:acetyl esterase/lipase
MPTRRQTLALALGALAMPHVRPSHAQGAALVFDPAAARTQDIVVDTATGPRTVTYRFWQAVPYASRPVDAAHQCLNLSEPVAIDGEAVDARRAPILLANSVGGYMPSSVADAAEVGAAGLRGPMGPPPCAAGSPAPEAATGSNAMLARGRRVSNAQLALAAGFVVAEPGARGRTLTDASGNHIGTAPAAIVDLKAAVRFLRANGGRVAGNPDAIVSSGTSAGGALSSLLGATGDAPDYADALAAIGAAEASDAILAAGAWCPITDLEHADMAYEWAWGGMAVEDGSQPDAAISAALAAAFPAYQASLGLTRPDGTPLTADSYPAHLTEGWLVSEATAFLAAMTEADRAAYLTANPAIGWHGTQAIFDWQAFRTHVGTRKKAAPAFDALDLSTGENNLFGRGTTRARHFTAFAAERATGSGALDPDIPALLRLMNPMPFLAEANPGRARHWWLRTGARDTDTSHTVVGNLDATLRRLGDRVNTRFYWDAGHGANEDADAFLDWIATVTGHERA